MALGLSTIALAGALALGCAGHTRATTAQTPLATAAEPGARVTPPSLMDARTIRGSVDAYTYAPTGEVNGLVLDGQAVHFPPGAGAQVSSIAGQGGQLEVTGMPRELPSGDTVLEAAVVTNLRSQQAVNLGALSQGVRVTEPLPGEAPLPPAPPAGPPPEQ